MMTEPAGRKAVFFDRDGTLNVDVGFLSRKEDFRWMEGAVEAIRFCNDGGYLVFVVTNQSGIARGYYGEEDVRRLHAWMNEDLKKHGAHIDAFYYCPHHPEGVVAEYAKKCSCRKPAPGLVEEACRRYSVDKGASFLFGDMERDVECARRAGVKGVLYEGGNLLEVLRRYIGQKP